MAANLAAEAAALDLLGYDDGLVRLGDALADELLVQRIEAAQVDDLDADAVRRELFRRLQRVVHLAAIGDYGEVAALADYAALAQGDGLEGS